MTTIKSKAHLAKIRALREEGKISVTDYDRMFAGTKEATLPERVSESKKPVAKTILRKKHYPIGR